MSLEALPNEVLTEIAKFVRLPQRRRFPYNPGKIANLALASKRLNKVLTPLIYRHYSSGTIWSEDRLFYRSLLERPDLGKHVRTFNMSWKTEVSKCYFYYSDKGHDPLLNWDRKGHLHRVQVKTQLKALGCSAEEIKDWLTDLHLKEIDAWMSLAVSFMPNLMSFRTSIFRDWCTEEGRLGLVMGHFARLRAQGNDNGSAMSRLQSVALFHTRSIRYPLKFAQSFISSKHITNLVLSGVLDDGGIDTRLPNFPAMYLTHLTLSKSLIQGEALISFVRLFKQLKTFTYGLENKEVTHSLDSYSPPPEFKIFQQDIGLAISHLKKSLERLEISRGENVQFSRSLDDDRNRIGSLSGFEELHTLIIPAEMIFGPLETSFEIQSLLTDLLPISLEELTIAKSLGRDHTKKAADIIAELMQRADEFSPGLRAIMLGRYRLTLSPGIGETSCRAVDEDTS